MINFLKYQKFYFLVSFIIILAGLVSVLSGGLRPSIDFTGGSLLSYGFSKQVSSEEIRSVVTKEGVAISEIRAEKNNVSIMAKPIDENKELQVRKSLEKSLKTKVTVLRVETVGPVLGAELIQKTLVAAAIAAVVILLYITYAFRNLNFAISAIGALVHDILVVVGIYSILGHLFGAQVDTLFVTALLTTMSFSVHDTIVIFDKIREYRHSGAQERVEDHANLALTETMVRSFNNSMTILFMLSALILLGGSTICFFIVALLIGTVSGTYSSPFIATPLLLFLEKRKKNNQ